MNSWRFQCSHRKPTDHPNLHSLVPVTSISTHCGCPPQCQLSSLFFLLPAMPLPYYSCMIFQLCLLFLLLGTLRFPVSLSCQPISYLFSLPTQVDTFCSFLHSVEGHYSFMANTGCYLRPLWMPLWRRAVWVIQVAGLCPEGHLP